jgi:uncharacterized Tic20 family protein
MQPPDYPAPGEPNPVPPNVPPAAPVPPVSPNPPPGPEPSAAVPPPYPGLSGLPPGAGPVSSEEKNWALAAHMSALVMLVSIPGVLGPLIVWLIQRDKMPFVNMHGKEALNFQLTQFFVMLACVILGFATCSVGFIITGPIAIADAIFAMVMAVIAGLKAGNGENYSYPLTWRLIK